MGVLNVKLIKATGLADTDYLGKTDPYVRLELEQDNFIKDVDYGYQKSSTKNNDCNPVWNEQFAFHNIPTLENMVLTLKVMDEDVGSKDDNCGKCKIKLDKEGITSSPRRIEKSVDRNLFKANAMIVVDISYEP
eukprot:jgi/Psemu1/303283/fgenesh1_kg.98_\